MSKEYIERVKSCLLGVHLGDSLGVTNEFQPPILDESKWQRDILGGGVFGFERGAVSDDGDLTIALLKSISENKGFNRKDIIKNYLAWQDTDPKDIGGTIGAALDLQRNTNLEFTGLAGFNRRSNGSLMRCSPMVILALENYDEGIIESQCTITHAEPICILCEKIYIRSLVSAIQGKSKEEIYHEALSCAIQDKELYEKLIEVKTVEWKDLSTSGYIISSFTAAYYSLLRFSDAEEALIHIINKGDDSDTTAAISGALCLAFYGLDGIPERWLSVLQRKRDIEELVNNYYK